jgi:eukaryotic-like serine/threonine-protein kinase
MQSNPKLKNSLPDPCSFQYLELVIHGSEQSPHYTKAVSHVEQCPACLSRLEDESTLEMPWWREAKESWLESELPNASPKSSLSSVSVEITSEMPEDSRVEFESVMLSFLDAPSHPELLGRLGRYEIERVIGTGGMGIVLKAHDTELHRVVAIKILAAHLANSASARKRFAREAQAAAAVLHPNVIPIYNVESEGKLPYLVMQCVSGLSLQAKIDRGGLLPITDALRIATQTAAGLAAAHDQGLVHRDVKPANILLEENVDRVILSDFGLARAVDDASLTRTGVVAGTPHYMSPEQARGDAIDTRSDQFSLGSVMYFMLTGRPPFRAVGAMGVLHRICNEEHRSVDEINYQVPREVSNLIDRLLCKDPSKRFETMHVVEQEIEHLLAALQSGGLSLTRRNSKRDKANWQALSVWAKRSIAFGLTACLGGMIATLTIWQLAIPNTPTTAPRTLSIRSAAEQLDKFLREGSQLQIDADRIERELLFLQQPSSTPSATQQDRFFQEVLGIDSEIQAAEANFSSDRTK